MSLLLVLFAAKATYWSWVHRFGAFMFFPLALWDNSPIPAMGSVDALLIVLAAHNHELWWYYALMATAASVIGAWPMYRIGAKGGEAALDQKLGEKRAKKIREAFEKRGSLAMFIGAIAPPPIPTAAFIGTAGAMKFSPRRFLLALGFGRLLRFMLLGWIASRYGRNIFQFLTKYYKPAIFTFTLIGVVGGLVALHYWRKARNRKKSEDSGGRMPERNAA
jgi:membrane protein DedA with SNARE-associated domain